MNSVDQHQEDRIVALEKGQKEILELLKPISDTYKTATTIGKWTMGALVFASVTVGLLVGIKNLK